ncbi:hypothetical protein KCU77_g4722, partial [Aureobasidium melanogenum]
MVHTVERTSTSKKLAKAVPLYSTIWKTNRCVIFSKDSKTSTYGHSQLKTGHPVRSAIHKQLNGRLVLRWVTTWESLLL